MQTTPLILTIAFLIIYTVWIEKTTESAIGMIVGVSMLLLGVTARLVDSGPMALSISIVVTALVVLGLDRFSNNSDEIE